MAFKIFVLIFSITTSVFTLTSAALYYIGYGLSTPHSGIVYSGLTLFWYKALLISSLISFGLFFLHGAFAGHALWKKNYSKAAQISLWIFVLLGCFLVIHLFRI